MLHKHKNNQVYRKRWGEIFNKDKKSVEDIEVKPKYKKNKLAKVPIEQTKNYGK